MESQERRGIAMDGAEVRRRRKLKGQERADLAERCEITPGYLSLLELNRRQPSPTVFARICDALGIAEDDRDLLVVSEAVA